MTAAIIVAYIFGLVTTPAVWFGIELWQRWREMREKAEDPDMHEMLRDACGDGCTIRREETA